MPDDPRDILKTAGVECAEVDDYGSHPLWVRTPHGELTIDKDQADAAILALATRLAAIVSYFEGEKDIDSAAPWALGEIRRILAEHQS